MTLWTAMTAIKFECERCDVKWPAAKYTPHRDEEPRCPRCESYTKTTR